MTQIFRNHILNCFAIYYFFYLIFYLISPHVYKKTGTFRFFVTSHFCFIYLSSFLLFFLPVRIFLICFLSEIFLKIYTVLVRPFVSSQPYFPLSLLVFSFWFLSFFFHCYFIFSFFLFYKDFLSAKTVVDMNNFSIYPLPWNYLRDENDLCSYKIYHVLLPNMHCARTYIELLRDGVQWIFSCTVAPL